MAEKDFEKHREAVADEGKRDSGRGLASFRLSGPGVTSATANHQTHVLLDLTHTHQVVHRILSLLN